jgi:hypothetical protein
MTHAFRFVGRFPAVYLAPEEYARFSVGGSHRNP